MIKAVFLDFYETLCFHKYSLQENLERIAKRYGVEVNWERCETALESLFAGTSAPDPPTEFSLLELSMTVMMRECEFIREVGIKKHVEQIAWELLQSGHYLFAANSATLYNDVVPTLQRLRGAGFKLAIVSNWDTPLDPLTERLGIAALFRHHCCFTRCARSVSKAGFAYLQLRTRSGRCFGRRSGTRGGYLRGGYRRGRKCGDSSDIA